MRSVARPMRARVRRAQAAFATAVMSIASVISAPGAIGQAGTLAAARTELRCAASAPIFATRSNGDLVQYQHLEPETGANSWGSQQQLTNWGLGARNVAGPGGVIYSAMSNGELRRQRWNGAAWDTFPNGLTYEIIDTNAVWSRFSTPDYVKKITVDAQGDIYTLEPDGGLHRRVYNPTSRTWSHRIVETGWSDYVLIVGAGKGVIYAVQRFSALQRHEYYPDSQKIGFSYVPANWVNINQVFSPGGDILYGVTSNGDLMWYRYNRDTETWINGEVNRDPVGARIGTGWQSNYEAFAAPDSCELRGTFQLQCTASVPIYTTRSGAFLQYQHLEPETGVGPWGTQRQIGSWGLTARHVAGPDGVVYNAINNGELRRMRWNGSSWDIFANGFNYEIIDNNPIWARFSTPEYRNKITVDSRGDIYTLEPDNNLHWRNYNPITRSWAHHVVEVRRYYDNLIVAAGPGVLYLRSTVGGITDLTRFEYHTSSQRLIDWADLGTGWEAFDRMSSPGGDILYGVKSNGDFMWYRYSPDTRRWVNGVVGSVPVGVRIGTGWQNDSETFAAPESCQLVGSSSPTRPQVTPWPSAPVTLTPSSNGHVQYAYTDPEGRGVYADVADIIGGPITAAAVPGMTDLTGITGSAEHQDGRIQIVGTGFDGEVRGNTQTVRGGPWATTSTSLGGFVTGPTTLVRKRNNLFTALSVDQSTGTIWYRRQDDANGPLGWWYCLGDRITPRVDNGPLTVVPTSANKMRLIGKDHNGTFHARADDYVWGMTCPTQFGQVPEWKNLGSTGFLGSASAVLLADNKLQVFATGPDGIIYTQRETSNGFSGIWTPVITGVTASGPPSAIIAPDGMIKIVIRGTDEFIYFTSQTALGSTTFAPWTEITQYTEESATNPTALAFPTRNTWVIAYRTHSDRPILRYWQPGPAATTSSAVFVDVPITPPA